MKHYDNKWNEMMKLLWFENEIIIIPMKNENPMKDENSDDNDDDNGDEMIPGENW